MRRVVYDMGMTLDGYVVDPYGRFDWGAPDPELFALFTDELRGIGVHLLGRRLYETMRYWEDPDVEASFDDAEREWARLWRALPKVVLSSTLHSVQGSCRLATGGLAEEVARWKAAPGEGDLAIGGATLAAAAAQLDLIDEYRLRVHPVLVGGGVPFFARGERRADLELVSSRTFAGGVQRLVYRVRR